MNNLHFEEGLALGTNLMSRVATYFIRDKKLHLIAIAELDKIMNHIQTLTYKYTETIK